MSERKIIDILVPADFEEQVEKAKGVTLVDFYTDWCPPCRALSPLLHRLAETRRVVKVNAEKHEELARRFEITKLPTLVFMKDGKEVERFFGLQTLNHLEAAFDRHNDATTTP